MTGKKTVLYVGCGPDHVLGKHGFDAEGWREIRLDIDPECAPDLVGSMTDLSAVADESMNAVYSSHNIEHLHPQEVPVALKEFLRVLHPEGTLVLTCPDLQSVCALVAQDKLLEPAYHTGTGMPIAPLDILYGHRPSLAAGKPYMAHNCGFTARTLAGSLKSAGFSAVGVLGHKESFALYAVATRQKLEDEALKALFMRHWSSGPSAGKEERERERERESRFRAKRKRLTGGHTSSCGRAAGIFTRHRMAGQLPVSVQRASA